MYAHTVKGRSDLPLAADAHQVGRAAKELHEVLPEIEVVVERLRRLRQTC